MSPSWIMFFDIRSAKKMKLHISLAKQDLAKCGGWQVIVLGMTELIRGLVPVGP